MNGGPSPQGPGLMRMLDGNLPVYLCWVRDDAEQLIGVVAVVCRQSNDPDAESRGFSFAHALLRPGTRMPAPRPVVALSHRVVEPHRHLPRPRPRVAAG